MRTFVRRAARNLVVCALPVAVAASLVGCGQTDEPYKPLPAFSGAQGQRPRGPHAADQGDQGRVTRTPSTAPCTICAAVCTTPT